MNSTAEKKMHNPLLGTLTLAMACISVLGAMAEPPAGWRFWMEPGDLSTGPVPWISYGYGDRVWFTRAPITSDGKASYSDGTTFEALPVPDGCLAIREGLSGEIWALIYDDSFHEATGIARYTYQSEISDGEWSRYEDKDLQSLDLSSMSLARAMNFLPTTEGRLLILLPDGLVEFDAASERTTLLKTPEETGLGSFIHMAEAPGGGGWITGRRGVARVCGSGIRQLPSSGAVEWEDFVSPAEMALQDFACPMRGDRGELFCTATAGDSQRRVLARLNGSSWEVEHSGDDADVVMGWRGVDDTIWVLKVESIIDPFTPFGHLEFSSDRNWTLPNLSRIQNGQEHSVERRKNLAQLFYCVAPQLDGAFWLGLYRGVARYAPSAWRLPPGCPEINNRVGAACEDGQGRLWFGSLNALHCLDGGRWKTYQLPDTKNLPLDTLESLCPTPDGRIALITNDGDLLTLTPGRESEGFHAVEHPTGRFVRAIAPGNDGRLWLISGDTADVIQSPPYVERYDGRRFETILGDKEDLSLGAYGFHLLETREGELWLSGLEGIGRYADGKYQKLGAGGEDIDTRFYCLTNMGNGKIWAGAENQILEFDGMNWETVSREALGPINSIVKLRDGSIWAASRTGIHRYVEKTWISNTEEEGLPATHSYTVFEDSQGRVWAGTTGGIALYHPETDPDMPETFIPEDENLAETSPRGDVRLQYSGTDRWQYTPAERLLYSYRLDNQIWSPFVSDTVFSATGQAAGEHRFEVRAIDRNWNVDTTPASFAFMVPLPWYREPGFLVTGALGILIILFLGGYSVSRYLYLGQLVASRTKELQDDKKQLRSLASELSLAEERERRRLASDLHDSISQSLSISMMELSAMNQTQTVQEVKAQAGSIRERLDEAFQMTQNLTFDLCPPELYQVGLESAIQELAARTQRQHELEIAFDCDEKPKPLPDDVRHFLFRATRELLFNVVKHANASAVRICVRKDNAGIQIQVSDDGEGFALADKRIYASERGAFGLFSIRERVSQSGGSLIIESEPGRGTMVSIVAPLSDEEPGNGIGSR